MPGCVQADFDPLTYQRLKTEHTQFRRLLQDVVHSLTAANGLDQGDFQGRLIAGVAAAGDPGKYTLRADFGDDRRIVGAVTVEQDDVIIL